MGLTRRVAHHHLHVVECGHSLVDDYQSHGAPTHYALLLDLALVIAAALRRRRIAGTAAAGLALNVWPMYGAFFGAGMPPVPNARAVRVAEFNVNIANDNLPGIAAYLESLTGRPR